MVILRKLTVTVNIKFDPEVLTYNLCYQFQAYKNLKKQTHLSEGLNYFQTYQYHKSQLFYNT